jgi:8-oxo-dGTP pyrophosphatase MutT (NUDIX family)
MLTPDVVKEIPGGACDLDDDTILHGLARELWEETGLLLSDVRHQVRCGREGPDGAVFFTRRGLRVCKFTFEVEVAKCEDVKLDPNEHQGSLWASEEEVKAKRVGDLDLKFTTKQQEETILEGFRVRAEARAGGVEDGSTKSLGTGY